METTRCLVIDDEADFAEFVADALDALGYEFEVCTDPTEIGGIYSKQQSVIILDLFMPGMDGIEILRFLHDNRADVALIFMSGKDNSVLHSAQELATEWHFLVLGALQKPFTVDELEEVLSKYAPSKKPNVLSKSAEVTTSDIALAIEHDQFTLAYQPQIHLSDRTVCGVETLIRWEHPEKGFISPGVFIPLAEQHGLIDAINLYVANGAMTRLGKWIAEGYHFTLSINVSPASIADLDFPEHLTALCVEHNVSPSSVIVEVTETAVMADVGDYMDILTRLRMKGFGLAIDDFGTGYSSLQQLVRLPFTELKIDQAFITHIAEDRECQTVTRMAIMLAHELGMSVVAEGVEDEDTMVAIEEMGCDEVQGFHCARPMEATTFEAWLTGSQYKLADKIKR